MFAKLIAAISENEQLVDFATGNTLFWLSAAALIGVVGWVLLMRSRHHKM